MSTHRLHPLFSFRKLPCCVGLFRRDGYVLAEVKNAHFLT